METEQFWRENCSVEYDTLLEKIPEIIHLPWIGNEYSEQERRILIVGDSHYSKDKEAWGIDFTRGIINQCTELNVSDSWDMQKNLLCIFGITDEQVARFWRSIAFCNMVQEPMPTSGTKPTYEQFVKGGKILKEIINIIRPTDCIIVGVRSERQCAIREWENNKILSKQFGERIGNADPFYGTYTYPDGGKMNVINIKHTTFVLKREEQDEWAKFIKSHLPEAFTQLSNI